MDAATRHRHLVLAGVGVRAYNPGQLRGPHGRWISSGLVKRIRRDIAAAVHGASTSVDWRGIHVTAPVRGRNVTVTVSALDLASLALLAVPGVGEVGASAEAIRAALIVRRIRQALGVAKVAEAVTGAVNTSRRSTDGNDEEEELEEELEEDELADDDGEDESDDLDEEESEESEDPDSLDVDSPALTRHRCLQMLGFELRAPWTPAQQAKHPRGPHGQFIHLGPRMIDAIDKWARGGYHGDPLAGFNRAQLLTVAKQRGIPLPAGVATLALRQHVLADIFHKDVQPVLPSGHPPLPSGHPTAALPHPPTPAVPAAAGLIPPTATKVSSAVSGVKGVTSVPFFAPHNPSLPAWNRPKQSLDIRLNGTDIGRIHRYGWGWVADDPAGNRVGIGGSGTKTAAIKALVARHVAIPVYTPGTVATIASVHQKPIPALSTWSHGAYALTIGGADIGEIELLNSGTWQADSVFGARNTTYHGTRDEAVQELVDAFNHAHGLTVAPAAPITSTPSAPVITTRQSHTVFASSTKALDVAVNGVDAGHMELSGGRWYAQPPTNSGYLLPSAPRGRTKAQAIKALADAHLAHQATLTPPGPVTLASVQQRPAPPVLGATALTISVHGTDIGEVHEDATAGNWAAVPTFVSGVASAASRHGTKDEAIQALLDTYNQTRGFGVPSIGSGAPSPVSVSPAVKAAQGIIYGTDPAAKTTARQLKAYGGLRAADFTTLDAAEQSTVLGDLSYIETTSKSITTRVAARKLMDRFVPSGTKLGTVGPQVSAPPRGAFGAVQTRVKDPAGTAGLLKVLPAASRGASGDGWTRTASGGTGPWGQYGAAGLMLRHVDQQGVARYLMVERGPAISDPGKWQFPGGAKEQKENFYQGAAREVVEELGLKAADLDTARVHGTHIVEAPGVTVPGLHGGTVPWAYVSIAATVPTQLQPDLSTAHARAETSDAKWMTEQEIAALDRKGKLLKPLAGGQVQSNVISLFPAAQSAVARPGPVTTRPARLIGTPSIPARVVAHKPSTGKNLVADKAAQDALRKTIDTMRPSYNKKAADPRLAAIGTMQGYDDTPTIVSQSEMDRLLATGDYIEVWRGVQGGKGKTAAQIHEDMRSGPAYYGTGIFGNGYYLAADKTIAAGYSDRSKNSMMRILIPKAAITQHYPAVLKKAGQMSSSNAYKYAGNRSATGLGTLRDPGRYAAAAGLDGIILDAGVTSGTSHIARYGKPAYNWQNRSVLIIQEAL